MTRPLKQILLPLPFAHGFDYRIPEGMQVETGDYVRVPFGRKSICGVVWGEGENGVEDSKIKEIERVAAHLPPMSAPMRAFIDWVAWYTLTPPGLVLKMALSSPEALEPPAAETKYTSAQATGHIRLTPARARIIAYLSDGTARSTKEICLYAKISANVVREFAKAGGLEAVSGLLLAADDNTNHESHITKHSSLSPDQHKAAAILKEKLAAGFSVTVLDGVTGSGKTEVYFDTIAECIAAGRQALVMLPEIALSVQWLARFRERFGFAPDVWHSGVSAARKRDSWRDVAGGKARVVVGARSALFLPFKKLGLIIVDEEHDGSYKQEEGVIYHARDMAVARASREKIPALLVSATPSLETEHNIAQGRYARVHLPARHGGAELPGVRLIDMRRESLSSTQWLSPPLIAALTETLARKQQALLFMNRRGYAPLMLCRACGHRFQCPHCTAWLVLHRSHSKLLCHHCGHIAPVPKQCPDCRSEGTLVPYGPGVERIAEKTRTLFPDARIAVMTSDGSYQIITAPGGGTPVTRSPESLIHAMTAGETDILIGTQMIAKGHHFAGLALVGVVDADMGLAGGDLRAGERTYQLLHQLSGRAGREKTRGEVWLQTYMPEHPVMQALASGDRDSFMALEARMREEAAMPPYGKLASVLVEGKNESQVMAFARELVRVEGRGSRVENAIIPPLAPRPLPLLLGPAPAPIALIRGRHRWRILVKAARGYPLQQFLSDWLLARKIPGTIRVKIDVDPYSFI